MKEFFKQYILGNIAFYLCASIAIILLIVSFFLPPMGEIHPSVVQATAELFAFAGLGTVIHAIDKGTNAKIVHKNTSIEVNQNDEDAI